MNNGQRTLHAHTYQQDVLPRHDLMSLFETVDVLDPIPPPDVSLPVPDELLITALVDSPAPPGARDVSPQPPMDNSQPATLVPLAPVHSPLRISLITRPQTPGEQGEALMAGDGLGTETAVLRALRWLRTTQHADGSWGRNRTAMTALSVLAYLGYGETPASPEFGETIEQAIQFILDAQLENGRFRFADGHDYTTPIAAYALSETYAITRIPMVKYAAEKAIAVVIRGQNAHGGFNYNLPTYQQPEALPGERALHDERDIPLTFVTSTSARQLALPPEALTR